MSNLVDRFLLYRIRTKRDPEAFAKIYDRHVEALYRFILLKVPSKEEAQDITAEAFTKVWQHVQTSQEITHIRGFLYRVARNLIVDFYRQRRFTQLGLEDVTSEGDFPSSPQGVCLHDEGREKAVVEARAELSLIADSLGKLKDDYRDILTLRLIDRLSFHDIGKILEKSTGNVRVMYHRALKALKAIS